MSKGIIFDLWGTLISSPLIESSDEIVKALNLKGKEEFWNKFGIVSIKPIETLDEVIKGFCKAAGREDKLNFVKEILKDIENKIKVFDDVVPTLSLLRKKKIKLGLITNTDKPSFLLATEKLNFERFFDVTTTSFEVGLLKPHTQIFSLTVDKLGLEFSDCIIVGDNLEDDILPAKKLGMLTVLISRKNNYKEKPENVDYLIKNLSGLLNLQEFK